MESFLTLSYFLIADSSELNEQEAIIRKVNIAKNIFCIIISNHFDVKLIELLNIISKVRYDPYLL